MKLNWGHKLVFFTVLFMLFILFMVYKISTQQVDLVDKNYYERGIQYQQDINKFALGAKVNPKISIDSLSKNLTFSATLSQPIIGTVFFYRPSDAQLDKTITFRTDKLGRFNTSVAAFENGPWKVTFEWVSDDKLFAAEHQFVIQ